MGKTLSATFRILAFYAAILAGLLQSISWILARQLPAAAELLHASATYAFAAFAGLAVLSILIHQSSQSSTNVVAADRDDSRPDPQV